MIMTKGGVLKFCVGIVFNSSSRLPSGVSYFFLALVRTDYAKFDGEF
jgi:hypothetical protein